MIKILFRVQFALALLAAVPAHAFTTAACQSQAISMIGIDPVNNIAYLPIFQADASNNSMLVLVNLTPGAAVPVLQSISLPGSGATYGITYNPNNQTILVAAALAGTDSVILYVIDTNARALLPGSPIFTNLGVGGTTPGGGILMDAANNRAIVAGEGPIGILNTATTPNTYTPVATGSTINNTAMTFNQSAGLLFLSAGSGGLVINTNQTPPWTGTSFSPPGFVTTISLGAAFDPSTNMMILTPSGYHDITEAVNFNTYTVPTGSAGTADFVTVDGLGEYGPYPYEGYGPGGWAAVNCATHQAAVADLDGENIKLIQLPTAPIGGAPDNNGQPYTGTTADASSAYTIADGIISKTPCGNPLYIRDNKSGSPAIVIDSERNQLYARADAGGVNSAQYLVRMDLSSPVLGGCPPNATKATGDTGVPCTLGAWTPTQETILLPGTNDCPGFSIDAGTNQGAALGAAFGRGLEVAALNAQGGADLGAVVTFTAPASGPGGTFANGSNIATATVNSQGLATAPAFTANDTPGGFLVTATAPGYSNPLNFVLTNLGNSVNMTVQTSPPGLLVSVDEGTLTAAPVTTSVTVGSIHSVNVRSPQTYSATQYYWNSWSDGQAQAHNVVVLGATTYTATFVPQYQLTASASPSSGGYVTPSSGVYNAGTAVPITATAYSGYIFTGWTGSVANASSASTTVTMSGPETVVANFAAVPTFTLSPTSANVAAAATTGSVSVTASVSTAPWAAASNNSFLTITSGASGTGSGSVDYSVAANTSTSSRTGTLTIVGQTFTVTQAGLTTAGLGFYPVAPCRVADTRTGQGFNGQFGPPSMSPAQTRTFNIPASVCNIPSTAQAYSLNVTVVPPAGLEYLTIWPAGQTQPYVSTLNSLNGAVLANAAIVPAGSGGAVSVYVTDATDVIIDINGYFAPPTAPSALAFYPVTPCRVVDTRNPNGAFGGPSLAAGGSRSFTVPSSSCGIPTTAQAYALNVTAVPPGPLTYVTTWPTGQTQPNVSTLNALQGQIAANAAIVPAGTNGAVSVFASDPSNVILDINGYFAPPGGAGALYFYPLAPCRIADTRNPTGTFGGPSLPIGGTRTFPIQSSACGLPATAQAYSLNMTVVPASSLLYLSTWPAGQSQPVVSTLNDLQGQVVANAAIVPAGSPNGGISVYVSDATNFIIDVNGYFGQ